MRLINPEIRFEVTNICNAKCIMCPREKMKRPQGVLDMALYKRVLDEAVCAGANQVSLENYGEPFMDPYLAERVRYAKSKGMAVFTITNAHFLDTKTSENIIQAGLDKLRISMYGTTKDIYEKIHVGLDYDKILDNVQGLFDAKKRLGRDNPKVEMYFLLLDENKHQMEDFKRKWSDIADDISIWRPHNWSDGRDYRETRQDKKSCGRPFVGPVQVQWDGFVVPCCFDYDSRIILGDLNIQSLHEALHDPRYEALREAHKNGTFEKFPFCNSCDQLCKREDVLVYTTIKSSRVGASNTNYFSLDALNNKECERAAEKNA